MRYLIVGLGNPGAEYAGTRHNTGWLIADALAAAISAEPFQDKRYGFITNGRVKNAEIYILKPTTFMNLSGNAVRYWLGQLKLDAEQLLVVQDDVALPLGKIRLRPGGSDGGHNGIKHITQVLGTPNYARLRFGIGNDYPRGAQVDYVLGEFSAEDKEALQPRFDVAVKAIQTFCLAGLNRAMNQYNNA